MIIERFGGKISLLIGFQSGVFGCGAFRHVPDLLYRIDLPFRYRSGHGDATGDILPLMRERAERKNML